MTINDTPWRIAVGSHAAVTGVNPELADMVNPLGEIVEVFYYVEAHDERGVVYAHSFAHRDRAVIEELADRIAVALDAGESLKLSEYWHYSRNAYGSEAWEEAEALGEYADRA